MWKIYKEQDAKPSYFSNFIEIAVCPFEESIVILIEIETKDKNLEEITPCFEVNLRNCAIYYISQFDVIEIIRVYDFLESYNSSYELYERAVKQFQKLSDQQDITY